MGWDYRGGGFMNGYYGQGPGVMGIIMFIVFWAVLALVLIAVLRHLRHEPPHLHHYGAGHGPGPVVTPVVADPAVAILKERFARGEVSEEEYTRRSALLKS